MLVKQVDRSPSFLAWCPNAGKANLLAAATREGTLDENFQSHNSLELFNTKFDNDCNLNIPSVGTVETTESFTAIAWGQAACPGYDSGLIAGGMNDGSLTIWDPNKVISNGKKNQKTQASEAIIHTEKVHTDPITSLDFNKNMSKYIASGSLDGKVYIWDLIRPLTPHHQLPPSGESLNDRKRITAVAWNCNVPYILSSSNSTAETSIWDLRNKRLAITFRSRSMQPATAVAWNPCNARQLVVSYDSNVAEIWDLRQFISPKAFLEGGHQRSILDVSWCPQDNNMLLTTGDDNQAILWSEQGQMMHQIPFESDSNFIAEWSPQKAGVLATCSFRGQIGVHSVQWCGSEHVPKWIKKPAGVNFGFGGRVVAFKEVLKGQSKSGASPKVCDMYKLNSDPTVGKNAEELASLLQNKDPDNLRNFANLKVSSAETDEEKTIWEMINLFYEDDFKHALFDYFGFPKGKEPGSEGKVKKVSIKKKPAIVKMPEDDLDDGAFFDRLGSSNDLKGAADAMSKNVSTDEKNETEEQPEVAMSPKFKAIGTCDPKVREALVTRNFSKAVELSLAQNRLADALVFAKHGGSELWDDTCSKFLNAHDDSFIRNLFTPVIERNFTRMVEKSDVNEWKQTLCMILSYAESPKEANGVITELGKKLTSAGHLIPAMSCFIVATDLPRLFGIWGDLMSESHGDHHPMIEKIFSISNAPNLEMKQRDREAVAKCYGEYANHLVAEGHVKVAAQFLMVTKNSIESTGGNSQDVNQLLHRINEAHPELGLFPRQTTQRHGHHKPTSSKNKNIRTTARIPPRGRNDNNSRVQPAPQPGISRGSRKPHSHTPPASVSRKPVPRQTNDIKRKPPGRTPINRTSVPERQPTGGRQPRRPMPKQNVPTPAPVPGAARKPVRRAPPGRQPVASPAAEAATRTHPPPRGGNPRSSVPTRNPQPSRKPPARVPRGASRTNEPHAQPTTRQPVNRGDPTYSSNRSPVPRQTRNPPSRNPAQTQPPAAYGKQPGRAPARRPPSRNPPGQRQPAQQPMVRQPHEVPASRKVKNGGFWGQQSSALSYTGETESDSRNVLENLTTIISDIEKCGKLNPMQTRQLKNTRNRVTQIQGLLSNRQITPQSYTKLADMVDSLLNRNFNSAMNIGNSIQEDKNLRMSTRPWYPAMKVIMGLARNAYN